MKIASLIIAGQVNSIYRSLIPMEALAGRGHRVHVEERDTVVQPERFLEFDVVHFWRCYHEPMIRLARRLREAGVPMVWDNDDDLASIPRDNVGYHRVGGLRGRRAMTDMARMMRMADVVTAPSAHLAARFRKESGVEVQVLENYLPVRFVRPAVRPRPGFTVGWLAALEHRADFERLGLKRQFLRLLEARPQVELVTVGLKLPLEHPRYHHRSITPYGELPGVLAQFDLAIAPLCDIPFNRARSNVKLKEYGAVGVPWLASPIGPYAGMGEEEGGQLVPDDGWAEAVAALVDDRDRRRRLAQRARAWARTQTIADHVDRWELAFQEAVDRAHARVA